MQGGALAQLGPNGSVAITIGQIAFREHPFIADYLPTGPFQPSSSFTLLQIVRPTATGITLTAPSPAVEVNGVIFVQRDAGVTFTASVEALPPGSGRPSGLLAFSDQSGFLSNAVVNIGNTSIQTAFPNTGPAFLTASWGEQFGFAASSATVQFEVVDQLPNPGVCQPPSGAVAWWHADGNYLDSVSTNNGTGLQVTFGPGIRQQGFSFAGTPGAFVEVPDAASLDVTTGLTIDAWINTSVATARIVDKISPFQENGYLLDLVNNRLRMQVGGAAVATVDLGAIAGTLTHVAGVTDGSRVALFVNGVLASEATFNPFLIPVNDLSLRIGADAGGGSLFTGIIDEPRIFNRALTDAEVQTLFQQGTTCP